LVTYQTFHNVYVYSATKLWAAYGAAIGVSLLIVCIGMIAIIKNGASYSIGFSTIFRIAKGAKVEVDFKNDDFGGTDPLPWHLKVARVEFSKTESNYQLLNEMTCKDHDSRPKHANGESTWFRRMRKGYLDRRSGQLKRSS
jgi:hypothetical protein